MVLVIMKGIVSGRTLCGLFSDRDENCRVIGHLRQIYVQFSYEAPHFKHSQQKLGLTQTSGPSVGHWVPDG